MSDSMIERIARSMARESGWRWDDSNHMVDKLWSGQESGRSRDTWRKRARAVLTDMREPTEAMKRVFCSARPESPKTVWHEVIDAALAEEG